MGNYVANFREKQNISFCVQGLKILKNPKNQISFHRHFKLHSQRLLLSVMYRSQKHVDFYETPDKQLEYIWEKRKNIHIVGDLHLFSMD